VRERRWLTRKSAWARVGEWFESQDKASWLDGKFTAHPFEKVIRTEMEFFTSNPEADKIRGLAAKVADISDIMQENMRTTVMHS